MKMLADNLFDPVRATAGSYQIIERPRGTQKRFEGMIIYTRRTLPNGGVKLFMRDRKKRIKIVVVLQSVAPFPLNSRGKSFTLDLVD